MTTWDERFRTGAYPTDPEPSPFLRRRLDACPDGRALDVATGTGRNAVALAEHGYAVDALDQSREGLRIARERARERGVADRIEWVQTDVPSHEFPTATYDLVTVSYYRVVDRLPDLRDALREVQAARPIAMPHPGLHRQAVYYLSAHGVPNRSA